MMNIYTHEDNCTVVFRLSLVMLLLLRRHCVVIGPADGSISIKYYFHFVASNIHRVLYTIVVGGVGAAADEDIGVCVCGNILTYKASIRHFFFLFFFYFVVIDLTVVIVLSLPFFFRPKLHMYFVIILWIWRSSFYISVNSSQMSHI